MRNEYLKGNFVLGPTLQFCSIIFNTDKGTIIYSLISNNENITSCYKCVHYTWQAKDEQLNISDSFSDLASPSSFRTLLSVALLTMECWSQLHRSWDLSMRNK